MTRSNAKIPQLYQASSLQGTDSLAVLPPFCYRTPSVQTKDFVLASDVEELPRWFVFAIYPQCSLFLDGSDSFSTVVGSDDWKSILVMLYFDGNKKVSGIDITTQNYNSIIL